MIVGLIGTSRRFLTRRGGSGGRRASRIEIGRFHRTVHRGRGRLEIPGRSHPPTAGWLANSLFHDFPDGIAACGEVLQMLRTVETLADGPFQNPPLIGGHAFHGRIDGRGLDVTAVDRIEDPHFTQVPGIVTDAKADPR